MAASVDHREAIEACTRAIESLPEDAVSYFQRAYHRAALNEFEEALLDLNKAIELGFEDPEVLSFRINILTALGLVSEATEAAEKLTQDQAKQYELHYNQAVLAFQKENYAEAIESFTKALELNPELSEGWYSQALCRHLEGDMAGAYLDYCEALKLDPNHIGALRQRAALEQAMGRRQDAIESWTRLTELVPEKAEAWYKRGRLRRELGQLKRAYEDFNKALKLAPELSDAWFQRGIIRNHRGEHEGAIKNLDKALECRPEFPQALAARALAKLRLERLEAALEDCQASIELDDSEVLPFYIRGLIQAVKLEHKDAIESFDQAQERDPKNAEIYEKRAYQKRLVSDYEGARNDLSMAQRLRGESSES